MTTCITLCLPVGGRGSRGVHLEGKKYLASFFLSLCWLRYKGISQTLKSDPSFPGPWLRIARLKLLGWVRSVGGSGGVNSRGMPGTVLEMGCSFRRPWLSFWHPVTLDFCSLSEPGFLVFPTALQFAQYSENKVLLCFTHIALTRLLQPRTYVPHKPCLGKVYGEGKNIKENV